MSGYWERQRHTLSIERLTAHLARLRAYAAEETPRYDALPYRIRRAEALLEEARRGLARLDLFDSHGGTTRHDRIRWALAFYEEAGVITDWQASTPDGKKRWSIGLPPFGRLVYGTGEIEALITGLDATYTIPEAP